MLERDGHILEVAYIFSAPTQGEITNRVVDLWWVPFVFWLVGTFTFLFARPKDTTWRLLIVFNYITALWLSAGGLSTHHFGDWSIWLRIFIWLSIPVYLHLHFVFPEPLWRMPKMVWFLFYGLAITVAIVQWFDVFHRDLYFFGFLFAIIGSLFLLIIHFVVHRNDRVTIGFLLRIMLLALVPAIVLVIYALLTGFATLAGGSTLFLPLLPIAYSYSIYRHRLGGMELRVNRAISIYVYLLALGMAGLLFVPPVSILATNPTAWVVVCIIAILTASLLTLYGFNRFQQFVERRFLNIRVPSRQLLESYAAQITATLSMEQLIMYLRDDIAVSLLIRQSALVRVDDDTLFPLYTQTVDPDQLSVSRAALIPVAGRYLPVQVSPNRDTVLVGVPEWIRLTLALSIENQIIGFWLLGRRDPDDYYSAQDIAILTTLAHQTATALHNILQTQRLHALYQNDIDEREAERASLARELHDQVLNELGILWKSTNQGDDQQRLDESFQRLASSLRETITGLRPAAVDFGLHLAITELVDRITGTNPPPQIELVLQGSGQDYPRHAAHVELHLYRIVQQALANALEYAMAKRITIRGDIQPESVELNIDDDGQGFEVGEDVNIASLVAQRHFGIAGMYERAHLIGAHISFKSSPANGTHIHVLWKANKSNGSA
jgi:signal transduction histidine kinase